MIRECGDTSVLPGHSGGNQVTSPRRTSGPGWVSEEGVWQRSDNACQSNQFIQRFRDTPSTQYADEFPTLVNKTMFILGDSVGRHLWDQLCDEIRAPKTVRNPPGIDPVVHYSEASVCVQPELNFTIVGFHQYGQCQIVAWTAYE